MNRRDYLSLTGVLVGSSAVGSNLLSRKAMAITYNLDTNLSFDYVENPQIVAKFSYSNKIYRTNHLTKENKPSNKRKHNRRMFFVSRID
jgi:hypothetical protein